MNLAETWIKLRRVLGRDMDLYIDMDRQIRPKLPHF